MADERGIGNRIAPPRFIMFIIVLFAGWAFATMLLHSWELGAMAGFDVAALLFLLSCVALLGTREARVIRGHAARNDANRHWLLIISVIVVGVLLVAIAAEVVGRSPEPFTKILIIGTLVLAWLFTNTIYALHYAHLAYSHPDMGCTGLEFPRTQHPVYWDFLYFSFTCGMAFATSDVQVTSTRMRRIVTMHCLAAFAFNIGVLAFTINVLGS